MSDYYNCNGPFPCIELSRYYTSDWGQVIQYVWRHQYKGGMEDLNKALWFARDAKIHQIEPVPFIGKYDVHMRLKSLMEINHAAAAGVWHAFTTEDTDTIIQAIERLIEKETK